LPPARFAVTAGGLRRGRAGARHCGRAELGQHASIGLLRTRLGNHAFELLKIDRLGHVRGEVCFLGAVQVMALACSNSALARNHLQPWRQASLPLECRREKWRIEHTRSESFRGRHITRDFPRAVLKDY
jgi:hypothetical protein